VPPPEFAPPFCCSRHTSTYGIRHTDGLVRDLFGVLRDHGLFEDAVVVILSDHGEEFLEHGRLNHGPTVYEEITRVPLLIHLPGDGGSFAASPWRA